MDERTEKPAGETAPREESIGRPEEWGEGRYEKPGEVGRDSVLRKPGKDFEPEETVSTPVTQEDYR